MGVAVLSEAIILSTGTSMPAQCTCRRRCRYRADIEPISAATTLLTGRRPSRVLRVLREDVGWRPRGWLVGYSAAMTPPWEQNSGHRLGAAVGGASANLCLLPWHDGCRSAIRPPSAIGACHRRWLPIAAASFHHAYDFRFTDASRLAREHGVVVVSVSYRLGALGHTPSRESTPTPSHCLRLPACGLTRIVASSVLLHTTGHIPQAAGHRPQAASKILHGPLAMARAGQRPWAVGLLGHRPWAMGHGPWAVCYRL